MGLIIESAELSSCLKIGLAKVKDATATMVASKNILTLYFNGAAVRYAHRISYKGDKGFTERAFDAPLLQKLVSAFKGETEISVTTSQIIFKNRSTVKITSQVPEYVASEDDDVKTNGENAIAGKVKNHPLWTTSTLKTALKAIKDNVAKTELLVEAKWGGESKTLDVMVTDAFHGVLCTVVLDEPPVTKKEVVIRLPLSSFLLLIDMRGDLYMDENKIEVKGDNFDFMFSFLSGSAFASIEDMRILTKQADQVKTDGGSLVIAAKKAAEITEDDDTLEIYTKKEKLYIVCETERASIKEVISCHGSFKHRMKLSPKNFLDILAGTGSSDVTMAMTADNLIIRTSGKTSIAGAMVRYEG